MATKKKIISLVKGYEAQVRFLVQGSEVQISGAMTLEGLTQELEGLAEYFLPHGAQLQEAYASCIKAFRGTESVTGKEWKKQRKELETLLKKLHLAVERFYPMDKKELVFFPYMYAMWDSLASVWRAAVDSGEYVVSVVPIPYYERNKDFSLGEMHYDGAEYPEEVDIISWETYSVAEHQPDVAYIHNPYDDKNIVTTIHPDFYAGKLKPHVGSLVYIPYFVMSANLVPDHFCITPVTLQADKIIVQSERIRDIYISNLLQYSEEAHLSWTRTSLEKKVLPLGSPKLDQAKRGADELGIVPDAWRSLIYSQDGTRKKVFFFNTSISNLLKLREIALDHLEEALMQFYLVHTDVVMLWRPHPLIEATYRTAAPALYQRYLKIKEEYLQGNWGILDESKDFQRAVSISDGYYGDDSSVVALFKEAKKPVMVFQSHKIKKE